MTAERQKATEPLGFVTALFGGLLLLSITAGLVLYVAGRGSIGGFGSVTVCVAQPNTSYSGDDWTRHLGIVARPGTTVSINGTLQACAAHPSIGQRVLDSLMTLPSALIWAAVLFLLWRLMRSARRTGPFTVRAAVAMRWLGWLIIVGSALAGAVQGFATDQLLNTMLVTPSNSGDALNGLIHGLLPVPLLAGAALLTFARIVRLGAAMDDEIKATV
jgi:Protein of unknown function (DUF2975)